ncbi:hypothetical protein NE237_008326 [Protea cynaroides]|uniref:DYW domain-containing protein n=1 Tax=Protea cynaroides TaxID=273540 RepID=A0A9Q0KVN2_9MAGN|nr:hypothetical protein NE237_008326 [Protea cynaroides]
MNKGGTVPEPKCAPVDPRRIHAHAIKTAFTYPTAVLNNLITLYSQANLLSYAVRLFHQIPSPNVVSWTALISAHANTHLSLRYFISMLSHPTLPNQRTFASLFKTCASLSHISFGLQLHSLSFKLSLAHLPFSGSALVSFYCRCRLPVEARKVFDGISQRDEVCYAAVIVGLAQNSRSTDALSLFADMRSAGIGSTMYSVSGALRAVAEVAALEQCRIIHAHAVVTGLDLNVVVGTALVDGYGKSGFVSDAHCVFCRLLPDVNIVGWNTMMAAYAQQGDKQSVLELFSEMADHGFVADEYNFLAILTAFSNAGSLPEAQKWLNSMKLHYGLEPGIEHYTCVVGAMARAGQLEEAKHLAMTMPFEPDAAVWRTLLSACAVHGAADMACVVGQRLLELDPQDDSAYAILANVHAVAGKWEQVAQVRKQMKDRRVRKEGGQSWIEVRGEVHVFLAGDRRHERTMEIYAKLTDLMEEIRKLGYVEVSDAMLHEVEAAEKREALWYHSEKLAVAFGLISGAALPGKPLRVVKNLRICRDCHEAFKYMSRVIEREIIVRDVNRYHRFIDGICTCGDYW